MDAKSSNEAAPRTPWAAWLAPIVCIAIGAWSWACQDASEDDTGADGGESGDVDDSTTSPDPTTSTSAGPTSNASAGPTTNGETGSEDITPADVLRSIALRVIVPATAEFSAVAGELEAAANDYLTTITDDPNGAGDQLDALEQAFRGAMRVWQRLEVMQVGPAGPSSNAIAGENIRDDIYSWPAINTCRVDQRIVDGTFTADTFFADNLINAYGLGALEYLVFVHDSGHTCPQQVQLDGPWTALGEEEIERRRAAYAHVVAREVHRLGTALADRWSPEGGNFAELLASPGTGESPYADDMQGLNEVFRAMFYVDKLTKDAKIGRTLGYSDGCAAVPCPNLLELPHARTGAEALVSNLEALALLVTGGEDPAASAGFDDLLVLAGEPGIAETLLTEIDGAIAVLSKLDTPLQSLVVNEPKRAEEVYAQIKDVTDTLKGPFVMALRLTIPAEGAGDND